MPTSMDECVVGTNLREEPINDHALEQGLGSYFDLGVNWGILHHAATWKSIFRRSIVSFRHHQQHQLSTTGRQQSRRNMSTPSSDEVKKAIAAAAEQSADDSAPATIFDKIIAGDIPCDKVFEDDTALAFRDINPQAPVHILVIPKQRQGLTQVSKAVGANEAALGHLLFVAGQIGQKECPNGFRLVINDGSDGAQTVYHLHIHIMGGRQMAWPPG